MNARVLVIPDIHAPYHHPDTIPFLSKVKDIYQPDKVICLGDEVDFHATSYHEHDPNLLSPGDELQMAIKTLKSLYSEFPVVDVLESNHTSLIYRKGRTAGIPKDAFKGYQDLLQAPSTWKWHLDLTLKLSNNQLCYFHHGKTSQPLQLSQSMGMNAVQGHFHEKFAINYWQSPVGLFWQMSAGCLVDNSSLAFVYNRNNLKIPILGIGLILKGLPRLVPMILKKNGRWNGELL